MELPFRNVQGGGTGWQTGYYAGNPLELGVWAVAAGHSVGSAQAEKDGAGVPVNRLAQLNVLTEAPPAGPVAFKFQVQPDGQWQLLIDFMSDGVVDVDVTSEQAGNLRHPFSGLSEQSGLFVTTACAGSNPSGTVGSTAVRLSYQESADETVPTPNRERRPLIVDIPNESYISPVCVEGERWNGAYTISAKADDVPLVVNVLGTAGFFADVPLNILAPVTLAVSQSGTPATTVAGSIAWTALDLRDLIVSTDTYRVRRSDQLLVTVSGEGTGAVEVKVYALVNNERVQVGETRSGAFGDKWALIFDPAGYYEVVGYVDGAEAGSISVECVETALPDPVICEVGFTRGLNVRASSPAVEFSTGDPGIVNSWTQEATPDGIHRRLALQCFLKGETTLMARLGSSGPAYQPALIQTFVLEIPARSDVVLNRATRTAGTELIMRPFRDGLDFHMAMFASRSSFAGGQTAFQAASADFQVEEDLASGETIGRLPFDIEMPLGESSYCFSVDVYQLGEDLEAVNRTVINGDACEAEITPVYFGQGTGAEKDMTIRTWNTKKAAHNHPIRILEAAANITLNPQAVPFPPGVGQDNKGIETTVKVTTQAATPAKGYVVYIGNSNDPAAQRKPHDTVPPALFKDAIVVLGADLNLANVPDDKEEDPGATVKVGSAIGLECKVTIPASVSITGDYTLTLVQPAANVEVYEKDQKVLDAAISTVRWPSEDYGVGKTLSVKGLAASPRLGVSLKLTFAGASPNNDVTCSDAVKVTVAGQVITITQVSFLESVALKTSKGGRTVGNPVYWDANANGSTKDLYDRDDPVCYVKGSRPTLTAKFKVDPQFTKGTKVWVKAVGLGNEVKFATQKDKASGDTFAITNLQSSSANDVVKDTVAISCATLTWQYCIKDMEPTPEEYFSAGYSSPNARLYTILAAPQPPILPPWVEVLDLVCHENWAGGQKAAAPAVTAVGKAIYESREPLRHTIIYKGSEEGYGKEQTFDLGRFLTTINAKSVEMDCTAFANFYQRCVSALGVPAQSYKPTWWKTWTWISGVFTAGRGPKWPPQKWQYHQWLMYGGKVYDASLRFPPSKNDPGWALGLDEKAYKKKLLRQP